MRQEYLPPLSQPTFAGAIASLLRALVTGSPFAATHSKIARLPQPSAKPRSHAFL